MSQPINEIDYIRFLRIAKLILEKSSGSGDMSIYVGTDGQYVHIEMTGRSLSQSDLQAVFQYSPTFEELESTKKLLEVLPRSSNESH